MPVTQQVDNFLEHFGVKGMKWGVRKHRRTSDQVRRDERAKAVKNVRSLSDSDLDKRISRLEKERKLKTLTDESLSPGKTAAKQILQTAGKRAAGTILAGALLYGVKAAMTKQFNLAEAASYLTPKPKK